MSRSSESRVIPAGWICLVLATAMMVVSLSALPVYGSLFLAALILGIVAIRQKRAGHGIALASLSLLAPAFALVSNLGHNRWADGYSLPGEESTLHAPEPVQPTVVGLAAPAAEAQAAAEPEALQEKGER